MLSERGGNGRRIGGGRVQNHHEKAWFPRKPIRARKSVSAKQK
jgi:hypothetical protein